MRTIVIGAGVIGTASAYFLAKEADEVTVLERQPGAGLETSFANGAIIHASEVEPWSQPGMPRRILGWLGREDAPLLLRLGALPRMWRWGLSFLANCNEASFRRNSLANLRLALLSLETLQQIAAETGIRYDRATEGVLKIYRDSAAFEAAKRGWGALAEHGLVFRALTPAECADTEPALARSANQLAGALFFPRDEVGDCHLFTQGLAAHLASRGVAFRYGASVRRLHADGGRIRAVELESGERLAADRVVVAAGSFTPRLLRPLGLAPLIYPVKGVSITVPRAPWPEAPRHAVIDDAGMYGFIPVGERLRVAGSAEIAGFDATPSAKRAEAIVGRVIAAFPEFARCYDPASAKVWAGLRPVTPSGTAYIGATPISGLFVNAGHGHLGWTMACGSARVLAAAMSGRAPPIDVAGFPRLDG
jgi:D-amino-acid dehydrogenase